MARTQAPKRPPEDKRQWVHGAPNSKLSKGVGRGFNKGDNGKFVPKTTSVPLPARHEDVNSACFRDFLVHEPEVEVALVGDP